MTLAKYPEVVYWIVLKEPAHHRLKFDIKEWGIKKPAATLACLPIHLAEVSFGVASLQMGNINLVFFPNYEVPRTKPFSFLCPRHISSLIGVLMWI